MEIDRSRHNHPCPVVRNPGPLAGALCDLGGGFGLLPRAREAAPDGSRMGKSRARRKRKPLSLGAETSHAGTRNVRTVSRPRDSHRRAGRQRNGGTKPLWASPYGGQCGRVGRRLVRDRLLYDHAGPQPTWSSQWPLQSRTRRVVEEQARTATHSHQKRSLAGSAGCDYRISLRTICAMRKVDARSARNETCGKGATWISDESGFSRESRKSRKDQ